MTDWTNEQTVAIARRVITEPGASQPRRVWAAGVLSAAEYVMAVTLTPAEAEEVRRVMDGFDLTPRARISADREAA